MARRNYTRELLAQVRAGRVPVNSVGPKHAVDYVPRSKRDPKPWTNGIHRYSGREVHTEEPCGLPIHFSQSNTISPCGLNRGHNLPCHAMPGGYARYTFS